MVQSSPSPKAAVVETAVARTVMVETAVARAIIVETAVAKGYGGQGTMGVIPNPNQNVFG